MLSPLTFLAPASGDRAATTIGPSQKLQTGGQRGRSFLPWGSKRARAEARC
jgi:hypothetical protein